MAGKIIVIAPPGAAGRFILSLLADYYNIDEPSLYDPLNNEYLHNPSNTGELQDWMHPEWFWNGEKWLDWETLFDPSRTFREADIICLHNLYSWHTGGFDYKLQDDDEVYYVDVNDVEDYELALKLVVYKVITRSIMSVKYFGSQVPDPRPVDLKKWGRFIRFIKANGYEFLPNNIEMFRYFFKTHEKDWDWKKLFTQIRVENLHYRTTQFDKLTSYMLKEDERGLYDCAHRFKFTDFLKGETNTVLDNYKEKIADYHQRNLEFIDKFEKNFGPWLL